MNDNNLVKKTIAGVSVIASVSFISAVLYNGYTSYADAVSKPVINTNYRNLKAYNFPGSVFVNRMVSDKAKGTEGDLAPFSNSSMLPETCGQIDDPETVVYVKAAYNKTYSIRVQAYGSGQAKAGYNNYVKKITLSCSPDNINVSDNKVVWDNGALLTLGDSVVYLNINDVKKRDSIVDWTFNHMKELLAETKCASLSNDAQNSQRSFYYNTNNYKGLISQENVSSHNRMFAPAIPQMYTNGNGDVNRMFRTPYFQANAPESPLPKDVPASMPAMPAKPRFIAEPSKPSDSTIINYQTDDSVGAGCGWVWSGQKPPVFDKNGLIKNYQNIKNSTIASIDDSINAYNNSLYNWANDSLWKTMFINKWNDYVKTVNDIQHKWDDLNRFRRAFKPVWYDYLDKLYDWYIKDFNYTKVKNDFQSKIDACVSEAKKNDNNPSDKKSVTSIGGDSDDTQTKNDDSKYITECEAKLDGDKPVLLKTPESAKPDAPSKPDNTTIPYSWLSEADVKSKAKEAYDSSQSNSQNNESDNENKSNKIEDNKPTNNINNDKNSPQNNKPHKNEIGG